MTNEELPPNVKVVGTLYVFLHRLMYHNSYHGRSNAAAYRNPSTHCYTHTISNADPIADPQHSSHS